MLFATTGSQPAWKLLTGSHLSRFCNHRSSELSSRSFQTNRLWLSGASRLLHSQPTPLDEISRLRELLNRASVTNSKLDKERVVAEYGDLRPLLSYILSPYCRLHITSSNLRKFLTQREEDQVWESGQAPLLSKTSKNAQSKTKAAALRSEQERNAPLPQSLLELFQLLSSQEVTGGLALATVSKFLHHHGIIEQHKFALSGAEEPDISTSELIRRGILRPTALDLFTRCLDRNLKAGFKEKTLRMAFAGVDEGETHAPTDLNESEGTQNGEARPLDWTQIFPGAFEAALGKSVSLAELPMLLESTSPRKWLASRKLDGVRCLIVIQGTMSDMTGRLTLAIDSVNSFSRNGRPFASLAVIERELSRLLPTSETIKALLASTYEIKEGDAPAPVRFIIDGEICVLSPPDKASGRAKAGLDEESLDVQSSPGQRGQPGDLFVEDFKATVSLIRRKDFTIPNPAYFPFDLLTFDEFTNWRAQPGRSFLERIKVVEAVVSHFQKHSKAVDGRSIVRNLQQEPISRVSDVEQMMATASQRGWEGIMLRLDVPYEGKRSSAIRKFKEWKDAEYTVTGITLSTMRLPISGVFAEHNAMAAIQIIHKGSRVSVGSGFTPDERIYYAQHPEEIVGKAVTVEYFEESTTTANLKDVESGGSAADSVSYSLRFPRIKQIWGKERDI